MRQDHGELRMVGGHVVQQHRVGIPELDAPAARQARADTGLPGVEHHRDAQLRGGLVQRVPALLVRREALQRGVQLQPAGPGGDQRAQRGDRLVAVVRVHRGERDEHVAELGGLLDDLQAGQGRVPGGGVRVHGEHHGGHVPGPVVLGDAVDGGRPVGAGAEVLGRGGQQLVVQGEAAVLVGLDVHVGVDGGDRVQVDAQHTRLPCGALRPRSTGILLVTRSPPHPAVQQDSCQ
jgi:hypothetical protein